MNIGNKYRQNYCDFYPQTRRLGKRRWSMAAAALTVSGCIFFSGLLLAGNFS